MFEVYVYTWLSSKHIDEVIYMNEVNIVSVTQNTCLQSLLLVVINK